MGTPPLRHKQLVRIAKALADPTRLRVFEEVVRRPRLRCGDLGRPLAVSPATVSHHLRILADAGLVESEREGRFVHVRPLSETLSMYRDVVGRLAEAAAATSGGEPGPEFADVDEESVCDWSPTDGASPAARREMRRAARK